MEVIRRSCLIMEEKILIEVEQGLHLEFILTKEQKKQLKEDLGKVYQ